MSIPIPRITWPYVIEAGVNDALDFIVTAAGGGGTPEYVGALAAGTYASPEALLNQLQANIYADCVNAGTGHAFGADDDYDVEVSLSPAGIVTIKLGNLGGVAQMNWNASTATKGLATLLGFDNSTYQLSAATTGPLRATEVAFVAQRPVAHFWTPGTPVASDSDDVKDYARSQSVAAGGQAYTTDHGERTRRSIRFEFLAASVMFSARATSSDAREALQAFLESTGKGQFTYARDRAKHTMVDVLGTQTTMNIVVLNVSGFDVGDEVVVHIAPAPETRTITAINTSTRTLTLDSALSFAPGLNEPVLDARDADYFVLKESLDKFDPERFSRGLEAYAFDLKMGAYEA
jgi:uncharacterized protein YfiM (DUF2279 family)